MLRPCHSVCGVNALCPCDLQPSAPSSGQVPKPRLPVWLSQSAGTPDSWRVLVTQLCPTLGDPMTVACQAPLSMGFSGQKYWSVLPFPPRPMSLTLPPLLVPGMQLPSDTLGLATGSPTPGPP